jgi:hypothetical protein
MRRLLLLAVLPAVALAQDAVLQMDLIGLAAEAQRAVDSGDWKHAAVLTAALKDATREARNRAWAQATRDLEDRILGWLPPDTETVAVWQEPFAVPAAPAHNNAAETAQNYLLGLLNIAESGKLATAMAGKTLRLSFLAARRFAPHPVRPGDSPPLGMIDYQGCAVYVSVDPLPLGPLARPSDEVIGGLSVWASPGSQHEFAGRGEVAERVFVALPKPDTLIACNEHDFLAGLLARLDGDRSERGLRRQGLRDHPLWTHVDRTAPFWALRRFIPERAAVDPTQPANASVLGKPDPGAIGLAVAMDDAGTIKALWMSRSADDPWRATLAAGAFERKARSRPVAAGPDQTTLWELTIPGDQRIAAPAVFALMSCLGFAVML